MFLSVSPEIARRFSRGFFPCLVRKMTGWRRLNANHQLMLPFVILAQVFTLSDISSAKPQVGLGEYTKPISRIFHISERLTEKMSCRTKRSVKWTFLRVNLSASKVPISDISICKKLHIGIVFSLVFAFLTTQISSTLVY